MAKELKFIFSPKHPGDVFIKVKGTKDEFLCKFYGFRDEGQRKKAFVNANLFKKCWEAENG